LIYLGLEFEESWVAGLIQIGKWILDVRV